MANYTTLPSGRPSGTPPVETTTGAYYYKYSYSWTSKSASTNINLTDAKLKFDNRKQNNAYIFLSCVGRKSSPPEFGIINTPYRPGEWYIYTRAAGSKNIDTKDLIISPSSISNGIYSYKNKKITIRITLSGTNIIGQILVSGVVKYQYTVDGSDAGIGEGAPANTFLLGTSFVPNPGTTRPGNRDAYLKHVYLQNGKLYSNTSYGGEATEWVPDPANPVTYYSLIYDTNHITYNRFGSTDEEISINYN